MPHLKIGTPVTIKCYAEKYNGMTGKILGRDGEYYTVELKDGNILYDLYLCEFELTVELKAPVHSIPLNVTINFDE